MLNEPTRTSFGEILIETLFSLRNIISDYHFLNVSHFVPASSSTSPQMFNQFISNDCDTSRVHWVWWKRKYSSSFWPLLRLTSTKPFRNPEAGSQSAPVPLFSHFFQNFQNTTNFLNNTFIFEMCHCSDTCEIRMQSKGFMRYVSLTEKLVAFHNTMYGILEWNMS